MTDASDTARRAPDGKRALFSTSVRRPGTVVLECSECSGRARLSYVELVQQLLPVTIWIPLRSHTRWMRCPACHERTWVAVRWRA